MSSLLVERPRRSLANSQDEAAEDLGDLVPQTETDMFQRFQLS